MKNNRLRNIISLCAILVIIPILTGYIIYKSVNASPSNTISPTTVAAQSPTPTIPVIPTVPPEDLVKYTGVVEHIFFHPLIAYPNRAFDNDYMTKGYNDYFVTVSEFNKIIESLYKKDYILIDINTMFKMKTVNGREVLKKKTLMLPKGKKPVVISVDDINYYPYMIENGNVFKLVQDKDGSIATYSKDDKGEVVISHDNEIVPLLDKFVEEHPDFSMNGAKGLLCLTGYEGILGYRTDNLDDPKIGDIINEVKPIVERLKQTGWVFGSHSYGHINVPVVSYSKVVQDTKKWQKEVESIVGPTAIYIYPYGARVYPDDSKYKYLQSMGFDMFCAVGSSSYIKYEKDSIMQDRMHIDGIGLHYQARLYTHMFSSKKILDPVRPPFPANM